MNWDELLARDWMFFAGMHHIQDGLTWEGGELIREARWGTACSSRKDFKLSLKRICEWDDLVIQESINELLSGNYERIY